MSDKPRIIAVDDDNDILETLQEYFTANDIEIDIASEGNAMRSMITEKPYDLAILDLKLPGEDGLSLCRFLREEYDMGIVMLTGSGDSIDRIIGLEVGADDYVSKPFELRELLARVRSILRRVKSDGSKSEHSGKQNSERDTSSEFEFGSVSVNADMRCLIMPDGEILPLTRMEFDLIKAFSERPNRVLSRETLLEIAHGRDWEPFDRSIDVRVTRLRRKIEPDPEHPVFIRTIRGVGYIFDPEGQS